MAAAAAPAAAVLINAAPLTPPSRCNWARGRSRRRSGVVSVRSCAEGKAAPTASPPPQQQQAAAPVRAAVSLVTGLLSLAGKRQGSTTPASSKKASIGSVEEAITLLREDFAEEYFVTARINADLYDDNCLFADPTVSFRGLERWRRNISLLMPFFINPTITLLDVQVTSPLLLLASWRLTTHLKLPWRPYININGMTDYTLDQESLRVTAHVERWDVSPLQAIGLIFRPGSLVSSRNSDDKSLRQYLHQR
eukprot:jgi/Chlat1/1566/Chrsp123S01847